MALYDDSGYDVLEGLSASRSGATTEQVAIRYSGTSIAPVVDDTNTLTLRVVGNTQASAVTVIDLYYGLGA